MEITINKILTRISWLRSWTQLNANNGTNVSANVRNSKYSLTLYIANTIIEYNWSGAESGWFQEDVLSVALERLTVAYTILLWCSSH